VHRGMEVDPYQNILLPSDFVYVQEGTILMRMENASNKYRVNYVSFYAIFVGDFVENYKQFKKIWIAKCNDSAARVHFFKVIKEMKILKMSMNSYFAADPTTDDEAYTKRLEKFAKKQGILSHEECKCLHDFLVDLYNIPDKNADTSKCYKDLSPPTINPDYGLGHLFYENEVFGVVEKG